MSWYSNPFAALDTETTGLDWFEDRVIQIGVSYFDQAQFLGTNSWIINSGKSSADDAVRTHGITDQEQWEKGHWPDEVYPLIKQAIQNTGHLVIMNAPFDLNFLISEFDRLRMIVDFPYIIDPLVISRFYEKNRIPSLARGRRTLKALSERYGITDYPLHNAGHDSRRVGELAIGMAQRHGQIARTSLSEFNKKQRKWHREWSDDFASFADAKGFSFFQAEWPHREFEWAVTRNTDRLPEI